MTCQSIHTTTTTTSLLFHRILVRVVIIVVHLFLVNFIVFFFFIIQNSAILIFELLFCCCRHVVLVVIIVDHLVKWTENEGNAHRLIYACSCSLITISMTTRLADTNIRVVYGPPLINIPLAPPALKGPYIIKMAEMYTFWAPIEWSGWALFLPTLPYVVR